MREPALMKNLLTFLTIIVASSAIRVPAQQIPATPPSQWAINMRFYGTTNQPGRDDYQVSVHSNGKLPASIEASRPVYNEQGSILPKSPQHTGKLSDEACAAIYDAARSVILSHRIGEGPEPKLRDGDSVEITVSSFDRKISAVFDHSSAVKSREFKALVKVVQSTLPKEFLPRIQDSTEESEENQSKSTAKPCAEPVASRRLAFRYVNPMRFPWLVLAGSQLLSGSVKDVVADEKADA